MSTALTVLVDVDESFAMLRDRLAPGVSATLLDSRRVRLDGSWREVPRCGKCIRDVYHPTEEERTFVLTTTGQVMCWKCRRRVSLKRKPNYHSKAAIAERARLAQVDSRPRPGLGVGF